MHLIPLVLALLVIWREAALQLLSSITLSVVSFTWPPRGLGAGGVTSSRECGRSGPVSFRSTSQAGFLLRGLY